MLYLEPLLSNIHSAFGVINYITFRAGAAMATAFIIMLIVTPRFINWFKGRGYLQPIRDDGPSSHIHEKKSTPTMGGLVIILAILISSFLWVKIVTPVVLSCLVVLVGYGMIGFIDDYKKVKFNNSKGLRGRYKIIYQIIIGLLSMFIISITLEQPLLTTVYIPFTKGYGVDLGYIYLVLVLLILVGSSNAVNLTDGLDGLAAGCLLPALVTLAIISYLVGHVKFADYLLVPHIAGAGELSVFIMACFGAVLGFLWFNTKPAQLFMGDTGSIALGGVIGMAAIAIKHEITLAIIAGIFVIEALSVMIQVASYRWRNGKRVFLMAPIHHHFEKLGLSETKVVIRFWIIALLFALIGLATLKLR